MSTPTPQTSPHPAPPAADADAIAAAHTTQVLLRCAAREADDALGDGGLRLPVLGGAAAITATLAYRSPTGHHDFLLPALLETAGGAPRPLDLPLLASLLVDALAADDQPGTSEVADPAAVAARLALLERIAGSTANTATFLRERGPDLAAAYPDGAWEFLASEQALVLGHLVHPTPKSRSEFGPAELRRYSPELAGRFPLAWLAVDPDLVQQGSAVPAAGALGAAADRGAGASDEPVQRADVLALELLGGLAGGLSELADGATLVPAHPWQLTQLGDDPRYAALRRDGAVRELGEHGAAVTPTSSIRTVYAEDWAWQLKFSLSVRVTNSMRVTLPRELDRAVEAATVAQTSLAVQMAEVAPHWIVVHDPAYLAIRSADGGPLIDELSVLFRQNRWRRGCGLDASAVASLCQPHPSGGPSRLARIVLRLADETRTDPATTARAWFARYLDVFARSVLRIYLDVGLTFEPHQQNLVLELEGGWPARAVHRDSQGYFHREAAHADIGALIPRLGEATESIFPEALADERLIYYPFVNNAFGVIGALGGAGLVNERVLLGDLAAVIADERERGGRYPATLLDHLLGDERWPCKANLRTRIRDLDELVGDIADQSVYVTISNPFQLTAAGSATLRA
ncbi:MAG: hypothetical protein PGN13_15680 [Patulibacter minatonensis]